jgi:predicted nucleic acid-binding protein
VILADTSVWVDHLRTASPGFQKLLMEGRILTHPFVIGEIACGNLRQRAVILEALQALPSATVTADDEVLRLVEERRLWGMGIGWIEAHLLASALLTGCGLWTLDRRLRRAAARLPLPAG